MSSETLYTYYLVVTHGMPADIPDFWLCADLADVLLVLKACDTNLDDPDLEDSSVTVRGVGMTIAEAIEVQHSGQLPDRFTRHLKND